MAEEVNNWVLVPKEFPAQVWKKAGNPCKILRGQVQDGEFRLDQEGDLGRPP